MSTKYSYYKSPYGWLKIGMKEEKVCYLKLADEASLSLEMADHGVGFEEIKRELDEYFQGNRSSFSTPLLMDGTEFQKKVWKALREIPYGETRTYKDIAKAVGNEKASRAVGMANNKNPIHIVIPCHRVIGSNGKLVGYAGGLDMKSGLLDIESKNRG